MEAEITEALKKGPTDGLTAPQIASVVPGSYEGVKAALAEMEARGVVERADTKFSDENYPGYRLAQGERERSARRRREDLAWRAVDALAAEFQKDGMVINNYPSAAPNGKAEVRFVNRDTYGNGFTVRIDVEENEGS